MTFVIYTYASTHYRLISLCIILYLIRELEERNFYPTLTPEKAFGRYSEYIRFRLRWFKDLEDEDLPVYRLLYEPTTTLRDEFPLGAGRNRGLRYIDAYNGEPIWERI
ncbi:hypothetical protein [Desulfosporosinus sp. BICA1-9]|uniref:hypothetical protein n=1 Tax=Desulfosporosinus sp. BICA1-9 TaxID=1531958 RepID=UPI00054C4D92|nr:hypothetical protein [Desulfosporosinus sp. BICA1-9]KJS89074.1 MAG: hypothetical protein JL57_09525 [Desulfosporosinus sp. BICA1-9]HBW36388.1 hypothetical protein [Desulfosporosinus sp.]